MNTYPYSRLISVLIQCNNLVKERGGALAVVQSNPDFLDVLKRTRLDDIFILAKSEAELEGR
jgi:anti-anti-sigma regulatory factor